MIYHFDSDGAEMAFHLSADHFSREARDLERLTPKPEAQPPASLHDFSPAEWAVVKMAREACLATGGFPSVPGPSRLAAHLRDTAAFDARNPSPTPRRRSSMK